MGCSLKLVQDSILALRSSKADGQTLRCSRFKTQTPGLISSALDNSSKRRTAKPTPAKFKAHLVPLQAWYLMDSFLWIVYKYGVKPGIDTFLPRYLVWLLTACLMTMANK